MELHGIVNNKCHFMLDPCSSPCKGHHLHVRLTSTAGLQINKLKGLIGRRVARAKVHKPTSCLSCLRVNRLLSACCFSGSCAACCSRPRHTQQAHSCQCMVQSLSDIVHPWQLSGATARAMSALRHARSAMEAYKSKSAHMYLLKCFIYHGTIACR